MVIWHMWVQSLGSEVRYWLESIQESNYSPHGYNIASVSDSESHIYISHLHIFDDTKWFPNVPDVTHLRYLKETIHWVPQ